MRLIKAGDEFSDDRGIIRNITPDKQIKDILYITGNPGAVRGNHFHEKDQHYCYILSGVIRYEWQEFDASNAHYSETKTMKLKAGDFVVNDIMEKHRFVFETMGSFMAFATQSRAQEHYETDTTRDEF